MIEGKRLFAFVYPPTLLQVLMVGSAKSVQLSVVFTERADCVSAQLAS